MSAYKTEDEQVEDIKRWWEQNGKLIIILGIVAVASTIGYKTWNDFKVSAANNASAQYDLMLKELAAGNTDSVVQRAESIVKKSADLAYAALAALSAAKAYVDKGEYDQAATQLKWVLANSKDEKVQHIARIRLAKALSAAGNFSEALTYASHPQQGAFSSGYAVVKGDVYYKKGEFASAKTAYQAALDSSRLGPQLKSFIQLKLDDIGDAIVSTNATMNDATNVETGSDTSDIKAGEAG